MKYADFRRSDDIEDRREEGESGNAASPTWSLSHVTPGDLRPVHDHASQACVNKHLDHGNPCEIVGHDQKAHGR